MANVEPRATDICHNFVGTDFILQSRQDRDMRENSGRWNRINFPFAANGDAQRAYGTAEFPALHRRCSSSASNGLFWRRVAIVLVGFFADFLWVAVRAVTIGPMTDRERNFLARRLLEVEAELQDIADLRVNYAEHPDEVEEELLEEQDEIEWRLGVDNFERRDS